MGTSKARVELTILVTTTYRLTAEVDEIPTDNDSLMGRVQYCDPVTRPRPEGVTAEHHYRLEDVEVNGKPIIFD